MSHPGEENALCLEGSVVVTIDRQEFVLSRRRQHLLRQRETPSGREPLEEEGRAGFGNHAACFLTRYRRRVAALGRTGLDVFPLCLGGNVFGWTADEAGSFAVLDAYAAAGGNFVDTADSYSAWVAGNSGGESEEIIGRWLAARGNRDQMIVATKVGRLPGKADLRAKTIRQAAEDSLRRLQTDYIDLYYAHGDDDPDIPARGDARSVRRTRPRGQGSIHRCVQLRASPTGRSTSG